MQEIDDKVKLRIATSITLLRAGTGLFAASDHVNAREFGRFVEQIELVKNYPGVLGIGYSYRFSSSQKQDVIARMDRTRQTECSTFSVSPPRSTPQIRTPHSIYSRMARRQTEGCCSH